MGESTVSGVVIWIGMSVVILYVGVWAQAVDASSPAMTRTVNDFIFIVRFSSFQVRAFKGFKMPAGTRGPCDLHLES